MWGVEDAPQIQIHEPLGAADRPGGTPGHILIGYIAHSPAYRRSLPPTHTLPDIYHTHTQYERERIYTARRFSNPPPERGYVQAGSRVVWRRPQPGPGVPAAE